MCGRLSPGWRRGWIISLSFFISSLGRWRFITAPRARFCVVQGCLLELFPEFLFYSSVCLLCAAATMMTMRNNTRNREGGEAYRRGMLSAFFVVSL